MVLDRLHRVREVHWIMLPLPRLHQGNEHVEAIALRRVALCHHQALNLFEDLAVIALVLDWRNVHGLYLQTVCASILICGFWPNDPAWSAAANLPTRTIFALRSRADLGKRSAMNLRCRSAGRITANCTVPARNG